MTTGPHLVPLSVAAKQKRNGAKAAPAADDGRERINLSEEHFNDIVRRCARVLQDRIYIRGVLPFAVTRAADAGGRQIEDDDGAAVEIAGVRHRPGSLVFTGAERERVAFWLDSRALFHRYDRRNDEWLPTTCPPKLAQRIIGVASELEFRPCSGVARTPLFIGGEVIASPGWNAATGMILDLPGAMPPISDRPTRQDAKRALEVLLRLFRGYIKDNPTLRPLFAAAALTAALRASLPTAPAIVLDGNTIGAGKGKAARALAIIATGGLPAMTAEGHSDEETEKRIAAAILQGAPAILLDNLQRPLASTTLESILTDPVARIRKFGSLSDDVVTECRAMVLITANNATLRRDLLRRTLPVRLVVPSDKPELRRFDFDPVVEARGDRLRILAAAFTIARAWHRKRDHPDHAAIREKTLGSFEEWAAIVAGAVEWLTGINPIDVIQDRKDGDTADAAERGIICQLAEAFSDRETFTASMAASRLGAESWGAALRFKGEKPTSRDVGNWLMRRRDRRFRVEDEDGASRILTLEKEDTDRKGTAQWRITGQSAESGTARKGADFRHRAEPAEPESPSRHAHAAARESDSREGDSRSATFGGSALPRTPSGEGPGDLEFYE
jgi:hypothetical protein